MPRRPSPRSAIRAPKGPASGFGKERSERDYSDRIAWEQWAAAKARADGSEAIAQGHDMAAHDYAHELKRKFRTELRGPGLQSDERVLDEIRELVSENDHLNAYILGAESVAADGVVKKLQLVRKLRDLEGHLPRALSDYAYSLYKEMLEHAKQALDERDYRVFYSAF